MPKILPKTKESFDTLNQGDVGNLGPLDRCVLEQLAPKDDITNDKYILYQQRGRVYEGIHGKFLSENSFVQLEYSTNVKYPQPGRHPSTDF